MIALSTFFLALGAGLVAIAIDDSLFGSAITFGAGWARFLFAVVGTLMAFIGIRGWFKVIRGVKPDPQALQDPRKRKSLRVFGVLHVLFGLFLCVVATGTLGDAVSVNEDWMRAFLYFPGLWLIIMGLTFQWDPRPSMKMQNLRAGQGVAGRGKILEVRDTGWTINDAPRVDLDLEITVGAAAPYQANFKGTVPRLSIGRLIPGESVPVMVDRTDPQTFFIEWGKP